MCSLGDAGAFDEAELAEMLGEPAAPESKKRSAEEAELSTEADLGAPFSFPALA